MNRSPLIELKWGLIVGAVNWAWLYLSYYLGLHTNGVIVFQIVPLGWLIITITGLVMALRDIRRKNPPLHYWRGVGSAAMIGVVGAIMAAVAQAGYYKVINPAWPEYMTQQTRQYYVKAGRPEIEVEQAVEAARSNFTLRNYAIQSATGALFGAVVFGAIIMIFLRDRGAPSAAATPSTPPH